MRRRNQKGVVFFSLLLFLATMACDVPGFSTPVPTVTPNRGFEFLSFTVPAPVYTISMDPGDRVPGARLEYLGKEGDIYRVRINGREAVKRLGDSFIWSGVVAPGVYGDFNLRLTTNLPGLGVLPVTGGVKITLLDWNPAALEALPPLADALHFENIPVIEVGFPVGENILASTLVYEGVVTQGSNQFARLSGLDYAQGDSVVWVGRLRDNVYVRYSLRVLSFNEDHINLAGGAELWIVEPTYP